MHSLKYQDVVITISFENYTSGQGGTDKYIREQQLMFNLSKISMIHIYPLNKPKIEAFLHHSLWGMLIDGEFDGFFSIDQLINIFYDISKQKRIRATILHHFQWININDIELLIEKNNSPLICYIHDYMTVCPNGGLIKNGENFCGASFPNKKKCLNCNSYTKDNISRREQISGFLHKHSDRLLYVAPSEACKKIWSKCYKDNLNNILVIPHQIMKGVYNGNTLYDSNRKVRIAFLGHPLPLKGWNDWVEASSKLISNSNYELYHFGKNEKSLEGVRNVEVDFRHKEKTMISLLRAYNIDCAVLWSKVPETYSYTFFEAYSANCFVVTNEYSGNIADMVKKCHNGYVARKSESLYEVLSDRNFIDQLRKFKESRIFGPDNLVENNEIVNHLPLIKSVFVKKDFDEKKVKDFPQKILSILYRIKTH